MMEPNYYLKKNYVKIMPNGYMGKILWIDLSDNSFKEEDVPEELYKQYFGGYGLAAKYIYDHMPKNIDPLNPESFKISIISSSFSPFPKGTILGPLGFIPFKLTVHK